MTTPVAKPRLASPKNADQLLEMYFLEARSHLLETCAILDRIERADGAEAAVGDARFQTMLAACDVLKKEHGRRTEAFQRLFSEPSQ